jgi:hypothetical protein
MAGDFSERLNKLGLERRIDIPPRLAGNDGKAGERGELAGEGLGGCNADLGACKRRDDRI